MLSFEAMKNLDAYKRWYRSPAHYKANLRNFFSPTLSILFDITIQMILSQILTQNGLHALKRNNAAYGEDMSDRVSFRQGGFDRALLLSAFALFRKQLHIFEVSLSRVNPLDSIDNYDLNTWGCLSATLHRANAQNPCVLF